MKNQEIKEFVLQYIETHKDEMFEIEHAIWEKPELGMEEHFASGLLRAYLKKNGFAVEENAAGMPTAFVAVWGSGKPVVGFSVEFDALPGLSQKCRPDKAPVVPGAPGQGCGHNLLGAGGAMAAIATKAAAEKFGLSCTLKVFGTPAEELCIGKPVMGNAGLFHGLDFVVDWHPMFYSSADATENPAYFNVKYHYKGRTAHGNSPWHGRSALDAAVLQGHAIEMLREHIEPGPDPSAAHTINYTFSDTGPEFASVVPDRATLWCIGRFTKSEQLAEALARLEATAKGSALATGTAVEVEYITASHETVNNEVLSKLLHENLTDLGDVEFTEEEKQFVLDMQKVEGQDPHWIEGIKPYEVSRMAVTDSSEYSWEAPYCIAQIKLGPGPGWHNWMVSACAGNTLGEKAVKKGAEVLAATALDMIQNPELLEEAQQEWKEKMGGRVYKSLLPEGTPPTPTPQQLVINREVMEKYRPFFE